MSDGAIVYLMQVTVSVPLLCLRDDCMAYLFTEAKATAEKAHSEYQKQIGKDRT